jgi:NADH dehydrogenase/NADH:ubiquinone reductase (non-electrogenic)
VTIVEAGPSILGSFDRALVQHYKTSLERKAIDVRTDTAVVEIKHGPHPREDFDQTVALLGDGTQIPFGMLVWSAGLAPVKFAESCGLPAHEHTRRIRVDQYLR